MGVAVFLNSLKCSRPFLPLEKCFYIILKVVCTDMNLVAAICWNYMECNIVTLQCSIQTYFPPDLRPEYQGVYLYKSLILINTVLFIHCPRSSPENTNQCTFCCALLLYELIYSPIELIVSLHFPPICSFRE